MRKTNQMPTSIPTEPASWGADLKDELTSREYEARVHDRTKLTVAIVVRPTNSDCTVIGTPYSAVTTDISASGIGFLHTHAVPDKFVAITLTTDDRYATILVEVVRCRSVGNLYEIGCKFVRMLDGFES